MSKENYKQLIEKESESLNNLLDIEELKEFKMMTSELKDTWEKKQVFRTETEARFSVLQDNRYPTQAAKYWQCVREQATYIDNLMILSFEYRRNQAKISKLEKQIENEVEALNKVYKDSNIDKTLSTKLKYYITSVDGSTDKKDINNFVDNEFLSVDSIEFRNYMTSITPDVEFSVEVKNSRGEKERVAVPMTAKFFWPNSQL